MPVVNRIYIKKLWGALTVDWRIDQQIVVLAGGNGTGKSTILRSVASKLRYGKFPEKYAGLFEDITMGVENLKRVEANFFEFDTKGISRNERFCNLIDNAFERGSKKIIRNEDGPVRFALANGFTLSFDQLSAGEQELVKIYGRAIGMGHSDIYILDEPETSLHIDWQEDLLENILELGKGMQVIISTHSPSIIVNGWMTHVIQIESLFL